MHISTETGILIGLAIVGLIALKLVITYFQEHIRRHGIHNIIGRSLKGRRTDGNHYTNASFLRKSDGTIRGHPVGRVSKRHHRAGIANLGRTLIWILIIALTGYGAIQNLILTIVLAGITLLAYLAYRGIRGIKRLRVWYSKRAFISPLSEALGPVLELTGPEAEGLITMQDDYLTRKHGDIGRINLPPRWEAQPGQIDRVENIISARLPVSTDIEPRLKGRAPHILIKAAPPLPAMVKFSDYVEEIENLGTGEYLPGIDCKGEGYIARFTGPEPHHGAAWQSGCGKSGMLKSTIAQIKHNAPDTTGTVIDPKEASLSCMVGIPGFDFYNNAEEFDARIPGLTVDTLDENMPAMWKGIRDVYNLMKYRLRAMREDPTIEFPIHLFVFEEANSFCLMSSVWFKRNKPKGMQGVTPPIWGDYVAPLFWRARQANIFIILVAQSIQERFLGGLSLRGSLGLISLAKYRPNQYATYIGTTPIPKMQKGIGRALYNDGERDVWVQCLYESDEYLRDFAMANCRNAADLSESAVRERRDKTILTGRIVK